MANTTTTTTTEAAPEALQGAALTAATELAKLSEAVFTSITADGLAHVSETIALVMKLQPMLNAEFKACERANPTRDSIGAGLFHKHMTALMARGEGLSWKLDANLTLMAAKFRRNAKAWSSYTNRITTRGEMPSLAKFVSFQDRFNLGHFNSKGEITPAGEAYDQEQADAKFKDMTHKISKFDDVDFGGLLDEDATDEDRLTLFHELLYFANAQVLKMERKYGKTDAGKKLVASARTRAKATIGTK